jgi:hypothetical protein
VEVKNTLMKIRLQANGRAGRFPSAGVNHRGAEAANGGMMGNAKKKLTKTEKTSSKTGCKPRGAISRKAKVKPGNEPTPQTSGATPATNLELEPVDCGALLRDAIEKEIASRLGNIAKALVDKTIAGNSAGFRFATELTGALKPGTRRAKKRQGPSQAQQFTDEPQWQAAPEGKPEAGSGGVKTEG